TGGSGMARFIRATVFGTAAAVAGFGIYFGVMKLAKLEIGLISILVGLMVGAAVRSGSQNRGGWVYQLFAGFLAASAIVASYTAMVAPQIFAGIKEKGAANAAAGGQPGNAGAANQPAAANAPRPNLGGALLALVVVLGLLYAFPIIAGFQSPIGLLI